MKEKMVEFKRMTGDYLKIWREQKVNVCVGIRQR